MTSSTSQPSRRHPRSPRAQCLPPRARWAIDAQSQDGQVGYHRVGRTRRIRWPQHSRNRPQGENENCAQRLAHARCVDSWRYFAPRTATHCLTATTNTEIKNRIQRRHQARRRPGRHRPDQWSPRAGQRGRLPRNAHQCVSSYENPQFVWLTTGSKEEAYGKKVRHPQSGPGPASDPDWSLTSRSCCHLPHRSGSKYRRHLGCSGLAPCAAGRRQNPDYV